MLNVTAASGFGGGTLPPSVAAIEFIGIVSSGTAGSTHTFSNVDIGAVVSDKKVVVVATTQNLTGVTIDGNAMTQAAFVTGIVPSVTIGIYEYNGVLTSTEDIILSAGISTSLWIASVFSVTNASSGADNTGTDTSNSGAELNANVTCAENSVAVGGWQEQITGTEIPTVWTGLSLAGEVAINPASSGGSGYGTFATAQSPLNVTVTFRYTPSPAYSALVLASWDTA